MTAVAIWLEQADYMVWGCADTRISRRGDQSGFVRLTDRGAKLFALPIACSAVSTHENVQPEPHFQSTFGFAFAGATLPATMTYATASTALRNLNSVGKNVPTVGQASELVRRIGRQFVMDAAGDSQSDPRLSLFECAVFGYSQPHDRYQAFHIHPEFGGENLEMAIVEFDLYKENAVLVFGSGRERVLKKIDDLSVTRANGVQALRLPMRALEAVVREDRGDVGGELSIAGLYMADFRIYWSMRHKGSSATGQLFNGFDFSGDLGVIDEVFWVGGLGLA